MIISCQCGKLQFLIKKNEIPKNGRIVKCGICNLEWLQKPHGAVEKIIRKKHYIANLFLILLLILVFFGVMITFKKEILLLNPSMNIFYDYIYQLNYQLIKNLNFFMKEVIQLISQLL